MVNDIYLYVGRDHLWFSSVHVVYRNGNNYKVYSNILVAYLLCLFDVVSFDPLKLR